MAEVSKTLYADTAQTRFYLIPDDAEVPAGDLLLRSLTGARREVTAAGVEGYRVTEEQAKELAREAIGRATRTASAMLAGLGGMLQEASKRVADPTHRAAKPSNEPRVADALGVTEEQLRDDPDAVIEGLKRVGRGLQQSLKEIAERAPAGEEVTRERLRQVAELAGIEGDVTDKTLDELKETLRKTFANPEVEARLREATARLRAASEELRAKPTGTGAPADDPE